MPTIPVKDAPKGLALAEPKLVEREVDVLIVGGGMGACGAAFEACRWADRAGVSVLLVEKAALERSGAVAQGLSAINTYLGDNTPDDYVRMVRRDLMGIVREDLVFDVGRHVDDAVHLFEAWGLPCWVKDGERNLDGAEAKARGLALGAGAKPVRSGRWQIMINGESFKCIVAEAARKALGPGRCLEHVCVVRLLRDADVPNRIAGAVGFSVRENKVYVIRAKAVLAACGGAVNVYRPRATGEGMGRAWYPVWNAGSTYAMCAEAGAEMTMMENRFVPTRFKDGYGPVGAWFLLFRAKAVNARGEDYGVANRPLLMPYEEAGYVRGALVPTCLRNHLLLHELREGRGPLVMDTAGALQKTLAGLSPEARKRLTDEAWEDFLDMCVSQAALWAATDTEPEKQGSEIMPTEPYLLGSHSGCCGVWVSGPDEGWVPEAYKIRAANGKVYNRMTTVEGLFTAADGVGASGHKFSSGSFAEGRIAGKQLVRFAADHKDHSPALARSGDELARDIYRPWRTLQENIGLSTDPAVNPHCITPHNFMLRLMKCMDEYGGGCSTFYTTSKALLEAGLVRLRRLEEDSDKLAACDLHELLRCWEQIHRLRTARLHMLHLLFREETRYPGFAYRADCRRLDDDAWKCFVNSVYDPAARETRLFKKPYVQLIPDA